MKIYPNLYKKSSNGSVQIWKIQVKENKIIVEHGKLDGKMQMTVQVINNGKNIGKRNETNPEEQALLEAESKWKKQIDKGYVENLEMAQEGENNLDGIEPMLAHKYGIILNNQFIPDQNHKIKFPCAVQPKFDGIRCCTDEKFNLWSRKHKQFNSVPHINKKLKEINLPLADGELYNHSLKSDFEKIVSIVKQEKTVHPEHEIVEYHIYDIAAPDMTFIERNKLILTTLKNYKGPLKAVETIIVNSHEEIIAAHKRFVDQGYEGIIIRNLDSEYENKRSYNLQKLKEFFEDEFEIVGIKEGKGKMAGHAILVCKLPNGGTVDVNMEGDRNILKYFFKHPEVAIGEQLTIQYQGYTKEGSLRFPVGKAIRNYE